MVVVEVKLVTVTVRVVTGSVVLVSVTVQAYEKLVETVGTVVAWEPDIVTTGVVVTVILVDWVVAVVFVELGT